MDDFKLKKFQEGSTGKKAVAIVDCRWVSAAHIRDFTPKTIADWWISYRSSFPVQLEGLHAVFVSPLVAWVFNVFKSVVSEKLAKRVRTSSFNF